MRVGSLLGIDLCYVSKTWGVTIDHHVTKNNAGARGKHHGCAVNFNELLKVAIPTHAAASDQHLLAKDRVTVLPNHTVPWSCGKLKQ